jgi:hypothetical protein
MPFAIQFAAPRRRRRWLLVTPTGHPTHRNASYVTTPPQRRGFGIPSQHSCKQECDRAYGPNNDLTHTNLPSV